MAKKEKAGLREMDIGIQEGLIGLATAVILLLTGLIEKSRRENVRDHAMVRDRLDELKTDVRDVRDDLKTDIKDVRDELKRDVRDVRNDFADHLKAHADTETPRRNRRSISSF